MVRLDYGTAVVVFKACRIPYVQNRGSIASTVIAVKPEHLNPSDSRNVVYVLGTERIHVVNAVRTSGLDDKGLRRIHRVGRILVRPSGRIIVFVRIVCHVASADVLIEIGSDVGVVINEHLIFSSTDGVCEDRVTKRYAIRIVDGYVVSSGLTTKTDLAVEQVSVVVEVRIPVVKCSKHDFSLIRGCRIVRYAHFARVLPVGRTKLSCDSAVSVRISLEHPIW